MPQTPQQRKVALKKANATRMYRAQIKKDLKEDKVSLAVLILKPPKEIEGMQIQNLLVATPRIGRVRTNTVLRRCRISPSKPIGEMTARQRVELVQMMEGY